MGNCLKHFRRRIKNKNEKGKNAFNQTSSCESHPKDRYNGEIHCEMADYRMCGNDGIDFCSEVSYDGSDRIEIDTPDSVKVESRKNVFEDITVTLSLYCIVYTPTVSDPKSLLLQII